MINWLLHFHNWPVYHYNWTSYDHYQQLLYWPSKLTLWFPDSKVHGANMGPIWVLSAQDGPHAGPIIFAIWVVNSSNGYQKLYKSIARNKTHIQWIQQKSVKNKHDLNVRSDKLTKSGHEICDCPLYLLVEIHPATKCLWSYNIFPIKSVLPNRSTPLNKWQNFFFYYPC